MQQPLRDDNGVIPHDHPEISDNERLIRYLTPNHVKTENGNRRISSAAFSPSSPPADPRSSISVDIENMLLADGLQFPFRSKKPNGIAAILVVEARQLQLQVGWDPEPDNNCHGSIWGVGNNKSKRVKLAKAAELLLFPDSE